MQVSNKMVQHQLSKLGIKQSDISFRGGGFKVSMNNAPAKAQAGKSLNVKG